MEFQAKGLKAVNGEGPCRKVRSSSPTNLLPVTGVSATGTDNDVTLGSTEDPVAGQIVTIGTNSIRICEVSLQQLLEVLQDGGISPALILTLFEFHSSLLFLLHLCQFRLVLQWLIKGLQV